MALLVERYTLILVRGRGVGRRPADLKIRISRKNSQHLDMKLGTCLYLGTFYSFSLLFCSLKAHISLILERRLRFSCDQGNINIKPAVNNCPVKWSRGSVLMRKVDVF